MSVNATPLPEDPSGRLPMTIYDELIDMVETAEDLDRLGKRAEALGQLDTVRDRITDYLKASAS